jgi:hypothetical protein
VNFSVDFSKFTSIRTPSNNIRNNNNINTKLRKDVDKAVIGNAIIQTESNNEESEEETIQTKWKNIVLLKRLV